MRDEVAQLVELLCAHYGKSDHKARQASKVLSGIEAMRSLLSRSALTELHAEAPAAVQALYYHQEPSA